MAIELCSTKCCGMKEINNLSHAETPTDALRAVAGKIDPVPFVTFTGVTHRVIRDHASKRTDDYGQALADYITAHKLGEVIATPGRHNWTGNEIKVWVWTPDRPALATWLKEHAAPPTTPQPKII